MAYGFDVGLLQSHRRLMHTSPHRILKHSVFDDAGNRRHFFARRPLMKVHMLSETVAFRPYDFLIDVSSGPWDYGLPGSARCIDCFYENIESMGDIGNRDTSCRREGMGKRKFPSGGL